MANWYALYVTTRHEKKIVSYFLEQQIIAYAPISKKLQTWSDRKKWVEFPLISGYIFVNIEIAFKEKVLQKKGVLGIVKSNGKDAIIKDLEIEILKSIENCGYDITEEVTGISLNSEVEIFQGPLKGLKGTVVQFKNQEFVKIQLSSINQSITVKVPKNILKIINS